MRSAESAAHRLVREVKDPKPVAGRAWFAVQVSFGG